MDTPADFAGSIFTSRRHGFSHAGSSLPSHLSAAAFRWCSASFATARATTGSDAVTAKFFVSDFAWRTVAVQPSGATSSLGFAGSLRSTAGIDSAFGGSPASPTPSAVSPTAAHAITAFVSRDIWVMLTPFAITAGADAVATPPARKSNTRSTARSASSRGTLADADPTPLTSPAATAGTTPRRSSRTRSSRFASSSRRRRVRSLSPSSTAACLCVRCCTRQATSGPRRRSGKRVSSSSRMAARSAVAGSPLPSWERGWG